MTESNVDAERPPGDDTTVSDTVQQLNDHLGLAIGQHTKRTQAAQEQFAAKNYDQAAFTRDLLEFGSQVVTDSITVMSHLTRITRASISERR